MAFRKAGQHTAALYVCQRDIYSLRMKIHLSPSPSNPLGLRPLPIGGEGRGEGVFSPITSIDSRYCTRGFQRIPPDSFRGIVKTALRSLNLTIPRSEFGGIPIHSLRS